MKSERADAFEQFRPTAADEALQEICSQARQPDADEDEAVELHHLDQCQLRHSFGNQPGKERQNSQKGCRWIEDPIRLAPSGDLLEEGGDRALAVGHEHR